MKKVVCLVLVAVLSIMTIGCSQAPASVPADSASVPADSASVPADSEKDDGATSGEKDGGVIKIGSLNDVTGEGALGNQYCIDTVTMLQEEVNARNGIVIGDTRYQVEFVVADCESKPDSAVTAIQKLINQDNVIAIIGPGNSKQALAAYPIAQNAGVPCVATSATNAAVTEVGEYCFRVIFVDAFQGNIIAKYSMNNGFSKAAILYNNGDVYSVGIHDGFSKAYPELGGEIVADESYGGSDVKDYNVQLTKILAKDPDVLVFTGNFMELPLQIQQVRDLGYTGEILCGDAADNPPSLATAGLENLYDVRFVSAYAADSEAPASKEFTEKYVARFGREPILDAVLFYEAGNIVLDALTKCVDSLDSATLRGYIAATTDFSGPTGVFSLGADRNPISKSAVMMTYDTTGSRHFYSAVD